MIANTQNITAREIAQMKVHNPAIMGGHKKLKIYGKLKCPNAAKWVAKGHYVKQRVLFDNEDEAKQNNYRPCACCMPNEYKAWKENQN